MRMGAGGLLMEIATRPLPRGEAAPDPSLALPRAPRIAAVVLAAGRSTRLAPVNKLLAELDGRPMVARVAEAALSSQAGPVIVVVGHQASELRRVLHGLRVTIIDNPDHAAGLSTSIKAGLAAVPEGADGALFLLADMPRVSAAHVNRLIAAFSPADGRAICVPTFRAKRGNPVLWSSRFFAEMAAVEGDTGARALLTSHADQVCEVEMADDAVLADVDTPEALAALRSASESEPACPKAG
jgi:molybdenum cofactor cytidylyltransferase